MKDVYETVAECIFVSKAKAESRLITNRAVVEALAELAGKMAWALVIDDEDFDIDEFLAACGFGGIETE
jgi:hypothetical protein